MTDKLIVLGTNPRIWHKQHHISRVGLPQTHKMDTRWNAQLWCKQPRIVSQLRHCGISQMKMKRTVKIKCTFKMKWNIKMGCTFKMKWNIKMELSVEESVNWNDPVKNKKNPPPPDPRVVLQVSALSDKDDKFGGSVCTLISLCRWKLERVGQIGSCPSKTVN